MNIDAVHPDARIDRENASILLGYAAGRDGRLYTTDEAVDDWLEALGGGRFGTAVDIIRRHYASYDPQSPVPLPAITPGYIKHTALEQQARKDRLEGRAPHQIEARSKVKTNMPRWYVIEQQAKGRRLDLDPLDYEDRPRPHPREAPMTTADTRTARERAEELAEERFPLGEAFANAGYTHIQSQRQVGFIHGFLARDAEQDQEGDTLPGCTGSEDCPAPAHQHGCFADLQAHCNEPEAHPAEPTAVTAEQIEAAMDGYREGWRREGDGSKLHSTAIADAFRAAGLRIEGDPA